MATNKVRLVRDAGAITESGEAARIVKKLFESEGWKNVRILKVERWQGSQWKVTCEGEMVQPSDRSVSTTFPHRVS